MEYMAFIADTAESLMSGKLTYKLEQLHYRSLNELSNQNILRCQSKCCKTIKQILDHTATSRKLLMESPKLSQSSLKASGTLYNENSEVMNLI